MITENIHAIGSVQYNRVRFILKVTRGGPVDSLLLIFSAEATRDNTLLQSSLPGHKKEGKKSNCDLTSNSLTNRVWLLSVMSNAFRREYCRADKNYQVQ